MIAVKWDKRKLHSLLLDALKANLNATLSAAENAKEGSNHADAIAKSKYDTFGLELSYFAGSQFERARAVEAKIAVMENTLFNDFDSDDDIDIGAIIQLQNGQKKIQTYLMSDIGAGLDLEYQGIKIIVISPESPLGEAVLGLSQGDTVDAKAFQKNAYSVLAVH